MEFNKDGDFVKWMNQINSFLNMKRMYISSESGPYRTYFNCQADTAFKDVNGHCDVLV